MHFIKARIRELREKDKTQTGLAQAMGVTPARVTEIMKGERQVKASELTAMSNYLEMSVPEVVIALETAQPALPSDLSRDDSANQPELSSSAEKFGAYIREQRERKRMSPQDLAKAIGVSPAVIARVENEDWRPKEEKLLKIADVLGIDGDDLLARAAKVPTELNQIIKMHGAQTSASLLRATKNLSTQQLKDLIAQANKVGKSKP